MFVYIEAKYFSLTTTPLPVKNNHYFCVVCTNTMLRFRRLIWGHFSICRASSGSSALPLAFYITSHFCLLSQLCCCNSGLIVCFHYRPSRSVHCMMALEKWQNKQDGAFIKVCNKLIGKNNNNKKNTTQPIRKKRYYCILIILHKLLNQTIVLFWGLVWFLNRR